MLIFSAIDRSDCRSNSFWLVFWECECRAFTSRFAALRWLMPEPSWERSKSRFPRPSEYVSAKLFQERDKLTSISTGSCYVILSMNTVILYTVLPYYIIFLLPFTIFWQYTIWISMNKGGFFYCTQRICRVKVDDDDDLMTVTCVSWFPPHPLHHFWLLFLWALAGLLPAKNPTIGSSWHQSSQQILSQSYLS